MQYLVRKDFFIYFVILQSIGILCYITAPALMNQLLYIIIFTAFSAVALAIYQRNFSFMLVFAALFGALCMHAKTTWLNTQFIDQPSKNVEITGQITEIKAFENRVRVVINVDNSSHHHVLKRIRIKTDPGNFNVGDIVNLRANLFPPSRTILHNSFDFYFYFYFKGINAVGYTVAPIKVLDHVVSQRTVQNLRSNIEDQINANYNKDHAAVLNSLITGNANGLNKKLKEQIRAIGIAHIFAISGLHMGIIMACSFFAFSAGLKLYSRPLLFVNYYKVAAIFTAGLGLFYLILSDFAISAQRAYVMCCVFLLSLLFDRLQNLFKTLMISAIILLTLQPEALVSPSMQMSFAACIGLITLLSKAIENRAENKYVRYVIALFLSTFICTLYTMPFSVFHFQNVSTAGLIANLFVIPVVEFLVMPLCFLLMVLVPLKLGALVTVPAKLSVSLLLFLIQTLSDLHLPNFFVPKFEGYLLFLFTLFTVLYYVWRHYKWRHLMIIPIIIAISYQCNYRPNIIIQPSHNRMLKVNKKSVTLYGQFDNLEKKIIASHFGKTIRTSKNWKLFNTLSHNLDESGVYYINYHNNEIKVLNHYKSVAKPWSGS